ncbi:hypothetical protein LCGC14_0662810 [marine sediment metagenome]|uniref:Uncharacterized protein n=1 Tax=marine sediment metagenome TaxID=412755 RepID=A0A0F9TEG5_9ZZZZ
MSPEIIQIVIQGGAVGLFLVAIVLGYRLLHLAINKVSEFVGNHMTHLTETLGRVEKTLAHLDASIDRLVKQEDKD